MSKKHIKVKKFWKESFDACIKHSSKDNFLLALDPKLEEVKFLSSHKLINYYGLKKITEFNFTMYRITFKGMWYGKESKEYK